MLSEVLQGIDSWRTRARPRPDASREVLFMQGVPLLGGRRDAAEDDGERIRGMQDEVEHLVLVGVSRRARVGVRASQVALEARDAV